MKNPLVSIIIVNWNGEKYLKKCLPSLSRQTYKNSEIFFVDNASSDDSVAYVKKNYPHYNLVLNKKNLGYAGGHEKAFQMSNGELVLLLSMDTILEKNALKELTHVLSNDKSVGAVQPKLLMYPEKDLIDSVGSFFLISGILYHYGREKKATIARYNRSIEIFSGKGACLLFRKSVLRITGLFDKDYFAYFEDTDLCHRVWLSGSRIVYQPKAVVWHTGGGASKKMAPSYILFHSYKNRMQTYIKNLSPRYLMQVLPFCLIVYMGASLAYFLRGNVSVASAIQKSIIWNIFNLKSTLKKRKFIQKDIRKIRDDQFLPKLTRRVRLSYYYYIFVGLDKYKE